LEFWFFGDSEIKYRISNIEYRTSERDKQKSQGPRANSKRQKATSDFRGLAAFGGFKNSVARQALADSVFRESKKNAMEDPMALE
jgi:hypothetical protein